MSQTRQVILLELLVGVKKALPALRPGNGAKVRMCERNFTDLIKWLTNDL